MIFPSTALNAYSPGERGPLKRPVNVVSALGCKDGGALCSEAPVNASSKSAATDFFAPDEFTIVWI